MYTSYYMNGNLKIPNIQSNALSTIKYMVIDIDGTLTDGGIYYDEQGNEFKSLIQRMLLVFYSKSMWDFYSCNYGTKVPSYGTSNEGNASRFIRTGDC